MYERSLSWQRNWDRKSLQLIPTKLTPAIRAFTRCGFQKVAVIPDLVKEHEDNYTSITLMVTDLRPAEF